MSETELAWAAGFIEGEGTVGTWAIFKNDRGYAKPKAVIEAYNTEICFLEKLKGLFGGWIYINKKAGAFNKKDLYRWQVSYRLAYAAAKKLYPFFIGSKKEAIKAIIDLYEEKE